MENLFIRGAAYGLCRAITPENDHEREMLAEIVDVRAIGATASFQDIR